MKSRNSDGQGTDKSEHKLHQIGHHHGPETTGHGVGQHQNRHEGQQPNGVCDPRQEELSGNKAKGFNHLAQGKEGIPNADAVDRNSEEKCLDSSQPGRCSSAVAKFGEGRIGQHSAAPPEGCEDHGHRHMRQAKAPPLPVARQAATADQSRDVEGGINRKGGGRHGRTGEPTAQTTAGEEIILLTPIASGQPDAKGKGEHQIEPQKSPVDRCHAESDQMNSLNAFLG